MQQPVFTNLPHSHREVPAWIRRYEPLRDHSSWRIGGSADFFAEPRDFGQLVETLRFAQELRIPHFVIGRGTNLLFADEGFRGLIIKMGGSLSHCLIAGDELEAEAGALACRLARASCLAGLTGLEHIVGIPGSIAGLVVMNGGSRRESIGTSLVWVETLTDSLEFRRIDSMDCSFEYRSSRFQHEPSVITRVRLRLHRGKIADIRRAMTALLAERRRKFPRKSPNAGSVFKSSPALYSTLGPPGRLIEDCGFKGYSVGGAQVSPLHANFIVNRGAATAADVMELITQIRSTIHEKHGVWLETEIRFVSAKESGECQNLHRPR